MEKVKNKQSPKALQNTLTRILFLVLVLSTIIFFFPLAWFDSPIQLPLQIYTLLPLLSIPILVFYGQRLGYRKRDFLLLSLCLFMALLIFANFAVCELGCDRYTGKGIVIVNTHCSGTLMYCLF